MKILVFGADGFIGKNVCSELSIDHDLYRAVYSAKELDKHTLSVDISDTQMVFDVISKVRPEVIINCAGIVGGGDVSLNEKFSRNIIEQSAGIDSVKKIFICGSAGEYGYIEKSDLPVNENTPLRATAGYGYSKLLEEKTALRLAEKLNKKVIVFRIFNPIGLGMANRFLLTNLLGQINEIKTGARSIIELSRLDAKRDYIAVSDIARAFSAVVDKDPKFNVYNVGSEKSMSNGELLELLLKECKLPVDTPVNETSDTPEQLVANQADCSRMKAEFGWSAEVDVSDLVKEICK